MRYTALVPLGCAIVGFVLSMLCLFAGNKPGFMEEYHIITLNTSTLGHNLLSSSSTTTSAAPKATSLGSAITGAITGEAKNLTSEVEGELNGIENDIADHLAKDLGIKQFYSLHLMDMCEGTFLPNATARNAKKNVTYCSNQTAMYHFDITTYLNNELESGPLHINLTTLDFPTSIQSDLNTLSKALDATFVLYCIGIASAGCCIIFSLICFLTTSSLLMLANLSLASLSLLSLLITSIIVTIVQGKACGVVNKYGSAVGVEASRGDGFLVLTWVSVAAMGSAALACVVELVIGRKGRMMRKSQI